MQTTVNLGSAFGVRLSVHLIWVLILPLTVFTLIWLDIEPPLEATVTALLLFGSALAATVGRLYSTSKQGVVWQQAVLFPFGGIVERNTRSSSAETLRIEAVGLAVNVVLFTLFSLLWLAVPNDILRVEMEIVALFNLALFLYALLIRLTPLQDNLLHGLLAGPIHRKWADRVMGIINTLALTIFAVLSIIALGVGWLAFVWWFATAFMLSQATATAERLGEFRTTLPTASVTAEQPNEQSSVVERTI